MPDPMTQAECVTLAAQFKALAEPSRLQILSLVRDHPGVSVKALVPHLAVAHPTALHHVWKLYFACLLDVERVSGTLWLTVDLDAVAAVADELRAVLR